MKIRVTGKILSGADGMYKIPVTDGSRLGKKPQIVYCSYPSCEYPADSEPVRLLLEWEWAGYSEAHKEVLQTFQETYPYGIWTYRGTAVEVGDVFEVFSGERMKVVDVETLLLKINALLKTYNCTHPWRRLPSNVFCARSPTPRCWSLITGRWKPSARPRFLRTSSQCG